MMRLMLRTILFILGVGSVASPALAEGLSVEVSSSGDVVVIDGQSSDVRKVIGSAFDGQVAMFKRVLAHQDSGAQIESCSALFAFSVDFYGPTDAVGGYCEINRSGARSSVALCDSSAGIQWIDAKGVNKQHLIAFIATACAVPKIDVDPSGDFLLLEGERIDVYVLTGAGFDDQLARFQSDLTERGMPGHITWCDAILGFPALSAGGNRSYGGICEVESGKPKVAICDDEMVGHFKVRPVGEYGMSMRELAVFVAAYCTAG